MRFGLVSGWGSAPFSRVGARLGSAGARGRGPQQLAGDSLGESLGTRWNSLWATSGHIKLDRGFFA